MPKSLPNFHSLSDVIADLERKRSAIDGRTAEAVKARKPIGEKISAIRRVSEFVGRPLDQIEADAEAVGAEIDRKVGDTWAVSHNICSGTWNNILSNITTGIEMAAGKKTLHYVQRSDYPVAWARLAERIEAMMKDGELDEFAMVRLRALFSPAISSGMTPMDLDQEAFDRILEQKRQATRAKPDVSPWTYAPAIVLAAGLWNKVRAMVMSDNLPPLTWECHRPDPYLRREELSPELQEELDRVAVELRGGAARRTVAPTLVDKLKAVLDGASVEDLKSLEFVAKTEEEAKEKSKRPVSEHYITSCELAVRATVSALVKLMPGVTPASITRLREVCSEKGMAAMLLELNARIKAGKNLKNGKTRLTYGENLMELGRRFAGTPQKELSKMREHIADPEIAVGTAGMTPQRREDVNAMLENKPLHKWLTISDLLWGRVEKALKRVKESRKLGKDDQLTQAEISLAEIAIVAGILRIIPLRRKNLALLRYKGPGPTLVIPMDPNRPMKIRVPYQEMKIPKPGKHVAAWVDDNLAERILIFIDQIRPLYIQIHASEGVEDSEFLFPGATKKPVKGFSGHRDLGALADAFSRRMKDEGLGLMEFHIARHVTASVLVRANPENLKLVAKILGNTERTSDFYYVSDDAEGASMRYHRMLQKLVPGFKALYTATFDDEEEELQYAA